MIALWMGTIEMADQTLGRDRTELPLKSLLHAIFIPLQYIVSALIFDVLFRVSVFRQYDNNKEYRRAVLAAGSGQRQ